MLEKNRNMGVHGNMLEKAHINMLEKFCNMEIQSNMLAKNRNIGHWWRFSGFSNMPNEPFSGRKVLRFYVRFLVAFELLFSLLFDANRTTPNANRTTPNANRTTPNANRTTWDDRTPESMNAGKQTNKILPV
jgi:hypothetical protein